MNLNSILAASLAILLLSGCSSGGGGKQANASARFTLEQTSIQLHSEVGGVSPLGFASGVVSGATENVYVFAILSNRGILAGADIVINDTTGELTVLGASPHLLGAGQYNDTVVINVCNDSRCASHIDGSPKSIAIVYTVDPDPAVADNDGDGVVNLYDIFPNDPTEQTDTDGDGVGDRADDDDDNDTIADGDDQFPNDSSISAQTTRVTLELAAGAEAHIETGSGTLRCVETCSFDIDNLTGSYAYLTYYAAQHFTFLGYEQQVCLYGTENPCQFRQPHATELTLTPRLEEAPHMVVTASSMENGGFVELQGRVQCQQGCSGKVYGEPGARLTLTPVPHAGFTFENWGGACSGTGACEIELVVGAQVDVGATFTASSAEPFAVCPGAADTSFTGSGSMAATDVGEILPLCNGWTLYADTRLNQVVLADVVNATVSRIYQLNRQPKRMVLDTKHRLLYVSHALNSFITRVDLTTGALVDINVGTSAGAVGMAMTAEGELFLHVEGVALMDSNSGMFVKKLLRAGTELVDGVISFNDATGRLMSGSQLYRFDRETTTVHATGINVPGYSNNCTAPVLSADGRHLSVPCGGGNGDGYGVFDHYGENPSTVLGSWVTGPYPTAVAFVPTRPYVLISNFDSALVFSTQTHTPINSFNLGRCSYRNEPNVAVSSDSKILFGVDCESGDVSTLLRWQSLDSLLP